MSHLPAELRQFIKNIGETRSKQEQDRLVLPEINLLKNKFLEKGLNNKRIKELLFQSIFFQMLGFQTPFAHIQAVNLTQSKSLKQKRLGYLACTLFLNKDSSLLIMLVSTIQKDLSSSNVHQVIMGLTVLTRLMTSDLARALSEHVVKLLTHTVDLVRKKALLVCENMFNVMPNCISSYDQKLRTGLFDVQPSVMFAVINNYYPKIKADPTAYKSLTEFFVIILKQIIDHKLQKDYDFHNVPSPWMQIRLLRILQILGKNDLKTSNLVFQVLRMTLSRALEFSSNISYAIVYEAIRTVACIYPDQDLLEIAAREVSIFINNQKSTIKVMGIKLLSQLSTSRISLVQQHQMTVVDCLEEKDETLKKVTLNLLAKITSTDNVQIIFKSMLKTLRASNDQFFRGELVSLIFNLCQQHAPSKEWFIDHVAQLFLIQDNFLQTKHLNAFLSIVWEAYSNEKELGSFILQAVKPLKECKQGLGLKVLCWVLGQIGSNEQQSRLNQLVDVLLLVADQHFENPQTYVWIMDSLSKLGSCASLNQYKGKLRDFFDVMLKNPHPQVSQRASEIRQLGKFCGYSRYANLIQFEQSLSFLESYMNLAKKQGAAPYKRAQKSNILTDLLKIQPYAPIPKVQVNYEQKGAEIRGDNKKIWLPESEIKEQSTIIIKKQPAPHQPFVPPVGNPIPIKQQVDAKAQQRKKILGALFKGVTPTAPTFKGPAKKAVPKKQQESLI